jgi:hypothetical protein
MFRSSVGPDRTFLSGCFYDRLRLCVKRVISDFQQVAARNSPSGLISGEIDERRHYALMLPLKHQASNVRNGRTAAVPPAPTPVLSGLTEQRRITWRTATLDA